MAVRKVGGRVLRNNWSEVFLIEAEKMYTAAQRSVEQKQRLYDKKKKKGQKTRGRIEGEGARGWAGERAGRRE